MMFTQDYLDQFVEAVEIINVEAIELVADELNHLKKNNGRLFILGVGGSHATGVHAVNDFRKIAGIETYTFENMAEFTARTNDDGFDSTYVAWLHGCNIKRSDAVMVLSVGGGNKEKHISENLINALSYAKDIGCTTFSIVGRDGGYAKKVCDYTVLVPTINDQLVTPFTESMHSVILHLLVSHPLLKQNETKWESTK